MSIVSDFCVYCECPLGLVVLFVYLFRLRFIVFSPKNVEMLKKPLVLLCFRSQMLKKHLFCCVFGVLDPENIEFIIILLVFCSTSCVFNENPCAKMQKKQKSAKSNCFARGKFFECIKQ